MKEKVILLSIIKPGMFNLIQEKAEYLQMMLQGRKKKKKKRRETMEEEEETTWLKQNWKVLLFMSLFIILISVFLYIFTL